ncbi:hypothetical protein JOQ06_003270, partial [Pogonophryne albipinna]
MLNFLEVPAGLSASCTCSAQLPPGCTVGWTGISRSITAFAPARRQQAGKVAALLLHSQGLSCGASVKMVLTVSVATARMSKFSHLLREIPLVAVAVGQMMFSSIQDELCFSSHRHTQPPPHQLRRMLLVPVVMALLKASSPAQRAGSHWTHSHTMCSSLFHCQAPLARKQPEPDICRHGTVRMVITSDDEGQNAPVTPRLPLILRLGLCKTSGNATVTRKAGMHKVLYEEAYLCVPLLPLPQRRGSLQETG